MQHPPKWPFATVTAVLILASGCVGNPAAQAGSGSDDASQLSRSTASSPEPSAIAQVGTGRATIKGRVTYAGSRHGALASVGMLDSRNREFWIHTDPNGWYAFTGLDLGESYMLTFSHLTAPVPPASPVVRNVTASQMEMTVDVQLPAPPN